MLFVKNNNIIVNVLHVFQNIGQFYKNPFSAWGFSEGSVLYPHSGGMAESVCRTEDKENVRCYRKGESATGQPISLVLITSNSFAFAISASWMNV